MTTDHQPMPQATATTGREPNLYVIVEAEVLVAVTLEELAGVLRAEVFKLRRKNKKKPKTKK